MVDVSNTRDSVSLGYPNTEKRVENTNKQQTNNFIHSCTSLSLRRDAQRSIFDEIRGVWIADETLSRVFNISSQ